MALLPPLISTYIANKHTMKMFHVHFSKWYIKGKIMQASKNKVTYELKAEIQGHTTVGHKAEKQCEKLILCNNESP